MKSERDQMRDICKNLGLSNRLIVFSDGKKVVDFFQKLYIEQTLRPATVQGDVLQDVAIVILDINLPVMPGNEVIVQLKVFFDTNNIDARPVTCYLSHTREEVMKQFLIEEEQVELYFQKPMLAEEIEALVKIVDSCGHSN